MGAITGPFYVPKNMKNKIEQLKQTWTYNHKTAIIALALALAHVWPVYIAPYMPTYASTVEWQAPATVETATTTLTVEDEINRRTDEIYQKLTPVFKERARQLAIEYMGHELMQLSENSPHVDLQGLKEQYPIDSN